MKKFICFLFAALMGLAVTSCEKDDYKSSQLCGTWECVACSLGGVEQTDIHGQLMIFHEDGTTNRPYTWKLSGNKVTMSPVGELQGGPSFVFTIKKLNSKELHWSSFTEGVAWVERYKKASEPIVYSPLSTSIN